MLHPSLSKVRRVVELLVQPAVPSSAPSLLPPRRIDSPNDNLDSPLLKLLEHVSKRLAQPRLGPLDPPHSRPGQRGHIRRFDRARERDETRRDPIPIPLFDLLVQLVADEVKRGEVEESQGDGAVNPVDARLDREVVVGASVACVAEGLLVRGKLVGSRGGGRGNAQVRGRRWGGERPRESSASRSSGGREESVLGSAVELVSGSVEGESSASGLLYRRALEGDGMLRQHLEQRHALTTAWPSEDVLSRTSLLTPEERQDQQNFYLAAARLTQERAATEDRSTDLPSPGAPALVQLATAKVPPLRMLNAFAPEALAGEGASQTTAFGRPSQGVQTRGGGRCYPSSLASQIIESPKRGKKGHRRAGNLSGRAFGDRTATEEPLAIPSFPPALRLLYTRAPQDETDC